MARKLTEELRQILTNGCRGQVDSACLPDDDRELGLLVNQLLLQRDQAKHERLAVKANLLDDVDALVEVLEKISLGNFKVQAPVMRLPEMDSVQIGIHDMVRKLEDNLLKILHGERKVSKVESKYRHIFENAIEGLFQLAPDGRFLTANPSLCEKLGYECCEQLLHGSTPSLLQCFVRPKESAEYERILREEGQLSDYVCRLKGKNEEGIWAKISLRGVYGSDKRLEFYEGYLLDVTESKVKEQAEKEKQIALEGSKAKSMFLANMSHEIRTPLNAIIGFNRLILERHLPPDLHQYLSNAQESAELLLVLLNDILDFSKIEAGQLDLGEDLFDAGKILDGAIKTMTVKADEKGLRLTGYLKGGAATTLVGDGHRLRQILLNLMGNSIKFTEQGGVTVLGEVYAETEESVVLHFEVIDTGPGIPDEVQLRIFDSFCQADNSITRLHGGSGLGLAISKRLVALLDGEIWIESEDGRGATFHFTVKFRKDCSGMSRMAGQEPVRVVEEVVPCDRALHILLVEDNKFNVDLAQIMLEGAGHQVTVALSGLQALRALLESRFDLILMDVQMPEMDGIMATRLIRSCESGRDECPPEYREMVQVLAARLKGGRLPIIAMTANAMSDDREKCVEAGMDDYISKPYNPDEIFSALNRAVMRKDSQCGVLLG